MAEGNIAGQAAGADDGHENMPADMPATDPASYPIGTVIVHPDDDRNSQTARRRVAVDDSTHAGPYKGCRWERLTGVGIHDGGCDPVHSDAVVGWPVQPLAELAVVLVHEQDTEIQRLQRTNESLLAMLERMETLHITWRGPGGEEFHPDWCRECRVDKARAELDDLERQRDAWWNQRAAELAKVRASREAWVLEADRLDAELKERPTVWAYEQACAALEKRRVALVEALGTPRPRQGFYDAIDDVADLVRERAASRPTIPADAVPWNARAEIERAIVPHWDGHPRQAADEVLKLGALVVGPGVRLGHHSGRRTALSGVFYIRWKRGEPREGRVLNPLGADHPAAGLSCRVCEQLLGDGRSVQLFAIGPDDEESEQRHAEGRWYSAQAVLLHAECVVGFPTPQEAVDG